MLRTTLTPPFALIFALIFALAACEGDPPAETPKPTPQADLTPKPTTPKPTTPKPTTPKPTIQSPPRTLFKADSPWGPFCQRLERQVNLLCPDPLEGARAAICASITQQIALIHASIPEDNATPKDHSRHEMNCQTLDATLGPLRALREENLRRSPPTDPKE